MEMEYRAVNTTETSRKSGLYDILPPNAKVYYRSADDGEKLEGIITKHSTGKKLCLCLGLLRIYPLFRIRYLAANEVMVVLEDGEHKVFAGPGLKWVNGFNDQVYNTFTIGEDIVQGPIKILCVPSGSLKYAIDIRTSQPLLLGPGMHFFNDLNIVIPAVNTAISLNSYGKSKVVKFGAYDNFNFVFVRTGECGVVCTRTGDIQVLNPGLHFLEAPDAFRTFVSIQQEHLKFGSCDSNSPTFLTADNVGLHVEATMFYRIIDVHTAFSTSISTLEDLSETLRAQAMASLMTIIRSENFSNLGKSKTNEYGEIGDALQSSGTGPSAPPAARGASAGFQNIIHDAEPVFKDSMRAFAERYGFAIESLRIERIEFGDKNLQKQVSEFAVAFTKLGKQQGICCSEVTHSY
jgi:hypothetical protein